MTYRVPDKGLLVEAFSIEAAGDKSFVNSGSYCFMLRAKTAVMYQMKLVSNVTL